MYPKVTCHLLLRHFLIATAVKNKRATFDSVVHEAFASSISSLHGPQCKPCMRPYDHRQSTGALAQHS
jgi:hypothetical protein